ncbi:CD160 molecule [Homo sapiens]|uniref:CD160 antigen n=2 Tax=Homininae TaxID=207598 RepID=A0A2R9ANU1_PANPA|nr:CD160 antigen isoform X1 [Homo sapiens]XP_011507406.1 CD160 antigen isoform X1 [Homo sapiens]XP_054189951.1 CD160 antigen isoform X1 [Homo sapiens]XP_054189952.1 CD160 antigen isoform X1 [Homo sapiens]XP_054526035.1 CD160 antigen isoform X1 [Pan troglodytes]ABV89736.1 CD160 transmembrane isoform [Homo sapiens]KAI2518723.1 CD160 molecule [Homo sapiens]KAI4082262.1 CD160 molecule [Homo sapiens]|eukprot:XP_005272986.1 CD160 antigen isoform X1 [Homo sapiens]
MLLEPGRGCCALAILLAIVDIQSGGCINITSSASQEGTRLNLICTVWHKKEEAEGFVVFLCKDRSGDCSPETSLKQLRLKRDPGIDGVGEISSQLMFTISQVTPLHSGTYQCCARSQKSGIRLQGHFFSILFTETGNYTVTGLKQRQHLEFSHNEGTLSSGFLQEKVWVMLVTSLVALQGMSKRAVSTPSNEGAIIFLPPWLFSRRRRLERMSRGREKCYSSPGYPQESSNQFH